MTQNPYAQFGNPEQASNTIGAGGFDQFPSPQRTSVLAILSLVCALLCPIPGLSALAIVFGGLAILLISSSRGRLGGLGLAIAGVLIGLFVTVFWLLALVGMMSVAKGFDAQFIGPTSKMVESMESGDYATARQYFDPSLDQAVTDEQIGEFVMAYKAEVGGFKKMPNTIWEYITSFMQMGQAMQGYQSQPGEIPIPTTFEKKMSVLIIKVPQGGNVQIQPGGVLPKVRNIGLWVDPTTEVWLLEPRTLKPVDNSGTGAGAEDAADDEADAADGEKDAGAESESGG